MYKRRGGTLIHKMWKKDVFVFCTPPNVLEHVLFISIELYFIIVSKLICFTLNTGLVFPLAGIFGSILAVLLAGWLAGWMAAWLAS